MITVTPLTPADRTSWQNLFRAYLAFYGRTAPQELYDAKWHEFLTGTRIHARAARLDGHLAGITHFFPHPSTSGPDVCYLQDLFTAPDARGKGVGRALIAAVTDWARGQGCGRVYWRTRETNTAARALYDKVAAESGFLTYVIELP